MGVLIRLKVAIYHRAVAARGHLLGDCVGVQIHTADVSWGHVKVKVSGVQTHNERTGRTEHIGQGQWAQRDVGARPVEGKDHLSIYENTINTYTAEMKEEILTKKNPEKNLSF